MKSRAQNGQASVFLTAAWRRLAMLQFEVDPEILLPRVPRGTELDLWQGRALVSVVGFRFLDTRVLGVPVPFHRDFDEVNLRFYVRRREGDELRRGVVFLRELVPRRAIAWVANVVYGENYLALPMRHELEPLSAEDGGNARTSYAWKGGGRWQGLELKARGPARLPEGGSEEEFISEHDWGYARRRDGSTTEYQVEHPQWRVWQGSEARLEVDAASLYGPEFVAPLSVAPLSAFLAEGSEVIVRRGRRLAAESTRCAASRRRSGS